MNIINNFIEENTQLNQVVYIINQFRNQIKPINELIVNLSLTHSKTPKGIKEYISGHLLKKTRKSIKNTFDNINHLLYLFEKILLNPNDQVINLFNLTVDEISQYIKIILKYSFLIKNAIDNKDSVLLNQYVVELNNLYFNNTLQWYYQKTTNIFSLVNPESLNDFTNIDFNLIKDESRQGIFLHQNTIQKEIFNLVSRDSSLKPYYRQLLQLCDSSTLLDSLIIKKKNKKTITLEANKYMGQYTVSNNKNLTISHIPILTIKVSMNYLPMYMSMISEINIENFENAIGNNFTINARTEIDLNPINTLLFPNQNPANIPRTN